jgi:hypothetical protein
MFQRKIAASERHSWTRSHLIVARNPRDSLALHAKLDELAWNANPILP